MKIGIFGGSFDPPHRGHIRAAEVFLSRAKLDKLFILPAGLPPHKELSGGAGKEARLEMCRRAFLPISEKIEVSDLELKKNAPSYTVQTIEIFRESYPSDELFLFVGTDMFLSFEKWRDYEKILSECTLCVMPRDEDREKILLRERKWKESGNIRLLHFFNEPYIISSTDIRKDIERNGFSRHLSPAVNEVITLSGLYGADGGDIKRRRILNTLQERLPEDRVSHILSVEREVKFLSDVCSIPEERQTELRYAALLHDITRNLSPEEHGSILKNAGIEIKPEDRAVPVSLHSLSGAVIAKEEFGLCDWAQEAIRCHTTAKENMTAEEKILYLADYIEETRPFESCRRVREFFHSRAGKIEKDRLLSEAVLYALEDCIAYVERKGKKLHPKSLLARDFLKTEMERGKE